MTRYPRPASTSITLAADVTGTAGSTGSGVTVSPLRARFVHCYKGQRSDSSELIRKEAKR